MKHICIECNRKTDANIHGLCYPCYEMETKIKRQNRIALKAGLPHDLTLNQWRKTLAHFKDKCAYCDKYIFEPIIEHFIPVSCGEGGTTITNCVPACASCNARKANTHPSQIKNIPLKALEKVRIFLEKQK